MIMFYWAACNTVAELWTAISEMVNYKQSAIQVWPEAALIHTCMIMANIGNLYGELISLFP